MGLLGNFFGSFKKFDDLELAKSFKLENEDNNMKNMKSIVDKFVDYCPDSYYASSAMVIYIILLYKKDPMKVPPNKLNNLSIMERNIRFYDKSGDESLDEEEKELRLWYKDEFNKNVKFMESVGFKFSSDK